MTQKIFRLYSRSMQIVRLSLDQRMKNIVDSFSGYARRAHGMSPQRAGLTSHAATQYPVAPPCAGHRSEYMNATSFKGKVSGAVVSANIPPRGKKEQPEGTQAPRLKFHYRISGGGRALPDQPEAAVLDFQHIGGLQRVPAIGEARAAHRWCPRRAWRAAQCTEMAARSAVSLPRSPVTRAVAIARA